MKINYKLLDSFLIGESDTDDIPGYTKEEIQDFLQTHNFDVFSEDSLELLAGIWELAYKDSYDNYMKETSPNFFRVIALKEDKEEEDERQTL